MCTAITYKTKDHYFGRTLDYEFSYQESVTVTTRNFPLKFHCGKDVDHHFAFIGMATVADGYPLYYDATNEKGLSIAALNFPGNAEYQQKHTSLDNITPFELIPWVLCQCSTVQSAKQLLENTNLVAIPFSKLYPLTPLHWSIADTQSSICVEPMADGLKIYDNPIGVLTNSPSFDYHLHNIKNYLNLTNQEPENRFSPNVDLEPYSRGIGAIGLPGDLSSASRFIRAAFTKSHSQSGVSESESVSQFFHILGSVEQQAGCVKVDNGYVKTIYSSCCNTTRGIYYYKTYENSQLSAVNLHSESLDGNHLVSYPLVKEQQIRYEN